MSVPITLCDLPVSGRLQTDGACSLRDAIPRQERLENRGRSVLREPVMKLMPTSASGSKVSASRFYALNVPHEYTHNPI